MLEINIPLEEMKNYLRVDHDLDDAEIQDMIESAVEQVSVYLCREFEQVPTSIKLACKRMVAQWYEYRVANVSSENFAGKSISIGEIPNDAKDMLDKYRFLPGV